MRDDVVKINGMYVRKIKNEYVLVETFDGKKYICNDMG